jgi:hypothetical protein
MAESSAVSAGDTIFASDYNDLRKDVLDTALGHTHNGTDSAEIGTDVYLARGYFLYFDIMD